MCGIAGALSVDGGLTRETLAGALGSLIHRGPDGEGTWSDGLCALAQRRLAIIDLTEAGQAPLSNEDGSVWVTHNGEIYNFAALRSDLEKRGHRFRSHCDTEVIVHAYEEWGSTCVDRFRGMFAFAVWDANERRLFLARDRVGKKPLFYALTPNSFHFASEIQGMLAFPDVDRGEVDLAALDEYLSYGYIPAPRTGFTGISKLEPGTTLTVDLRDRLSVDHRRYWDLDYEPKSSQDMAEAAERVRGELTEAVRLRLISDVPLGAFLSGGIDSSIVVGLMAQLSTHRVRTFSIGFSERAFNELEHARRIAERWDCDHTEEIVEPDALSILPMLVRHYGEPYADSSAIPTFYVAQAARRSVTVALNGDGGDESFGGYQRYWAMKLAAQVGRFPGADRLGALVGGTVAARDRRSAAGRVGRFFDSASLPPADRYARWVGYVDGTLKDELYSDDLRSASRGGNLLLHALFDRHGSLSAVDQAMAVDVRTYLPYDLLVKVDIAAMACSLEARSPFLDHEVMELAARLPTSLKVRGRTGKVILREAFADLLPKENVRRPKMGFGVPVGDWLRGPVQSLLRDCLLSDQAASRGYFQKATLARLVDEHVSGRVDRTPQLWSLLMLELWHREVGDRVAA